ncbi:MAG TPA: hypothetical protein DCS13_11320 [Candidatus Margulisbacteria bacterium]|nr:MAG: hypothetical protein A2X43_06520 [Candidatus Margulisbacteria bacterium GWD2_39_127]HAR64044.1 hypothetical protein [Candidatus Margulisiibacteriota bacterium]
MKKLPLIIFEKSDTNFILFNNDALSQTLMKEKDWEPHFKDVIQRVLFSGDSAIDLGANFGYHTVSMASLVGNQGKIYAFEPLRIIFQQLCCNCFINGLDNVYPYNCAVGDASSTAYMRSLDYYSTTTINIGDTSLLNNVDKAPGDEIMVKALDSFDLKKIKFIKIDVQGCELFALKGAKDTIDRDRPIMFIEIEEHQCRKFGYTSEDLIEYLFSIGYYLLRIKTNYPCDHIALPLEKESEESVFHGMPYHVEKLKGKKIELTFTNPIYYNQFKILE